MNAIRKTTTAAFGLTLSLIVSSQGVSATPACAGNAEANRAIVLGFYTKALVRKQVRDGFEQYVRPDFIEHKPDVQGGNRENVIRFLEAMVKDIPAAQWTVKRTVAEDDLVAVHASFTPAPGAPDYAIADFFRLENCQIVEHWDVVGPPAKSGANPNSRF